WRPCGDLLVFDDLISESDACKVPIVKSSSPTLTPFGERDILFLENLLNEEPFQLPPMDLKLAEESKEKSSVEEPLELELKELPSHLDPWVSLIHCVPKKGGMTVVANGNNELIPTRLVIGWRMVLGYFQIPIDPQDQEKLLSHALMKPSRTDACPLACVMLQ
nr:reverse transcriptase domain-containing protein [Tanacetum cinerariifolium]